MSKLRRFYPSRFIKYDLQQALATVNVVDHPTDGEVGGRDLLEDQDLNFPARPVQSDPHGADPAETRVLRTSEIGQELTQLTTEREKYKNRQDLSQHGMWNDSYSDDDRFEDADLKLGSEESYNDDVDPLNEPVYEPYSQGNGPLHSRYEDADKNTRNIVLHSSKKYEEKSAKEIEDGNKDNSNELWVCVDLDGTILEAPEKYQDEKGNHLFGKILPGVEGGSGPREALQELIDGGARVSIYTARQYFDDESQASKALGLNPGQLLEFQVEEALIENDVPFTDIYIGKKPPAHYFIDDRTIPPFDGDWDLVLDTVRDKLNKKAQSMEDNSNIEVKNLSKNANDPVKETVDYKGILIDVEWPEGSIRSYDGQDTYVTHMKADYGYARGVNGNDGEEMDIYIADRDSDSESAFIIEQIREDGSYDEDKIVFGAHTEGDAIDCFLNHMPPFMLGDVREVPVDKLRDAIYKGPEDRRGEDDLVPSEENNKEATWTDPQEWTISTEELFEHMDRLKEDSPDEFKSWLDFIGAENEEHYEDMKYIWNSSNVSIVLRGLPKTSNIKHWVKKVAAYSDLAIRVLEDANINEATKLVSQYIDITTDYAQMVDSLVREMLTNPDLKEYLEQQYGPVEVRRPVEEQLEQEVKEHPSTMWGPMRAPSGPTQTQEVQYGPTGTQPIVKAYIKASRKADSTQGVWPQDLDKFENEFLNPTEDRDNKEIRRPPSTERMKYRNT